MHFSILDSDNILNVGTVANDNTGDNLRTAGQKINANFEALDSAIGAIASLPEATVTNSTIRYDGSVYVSTDGLKVDNSGNTTVGGNITFSDSDDLIMPDKSQIKLGDDADLQIYHDGGASGNSRIRALNGDNLFIETFANDANIVIKTDNGSGGNPVNYIVADGGNGQVQLYYYGNQKFNTTATGVDVTGEVVADSATISGNLTVSGDITFSDSDDLILPDKSQIKLGDASDLQIYHNGSASFISEQGTGALKILASSLEVKNAADATTMVTAQSGGAVNLRHNNVEKLATTSTGINVTGEVVADSATISGNVTITGSLVADSATISGNVNVNKTITGSLVADSATISGNLTANTISLGASGTINGDLTVDGNIVLSDSNDITMPDRSMIKLGTDSDFAIHFDSNNHAVIETTKANTPLVFKHNNVEVMRLTDGEVTIAGDLTVDTVNQSAGSMFAASNYETVLRAYGSITAGTYLLRPNPVGFSPYTFTTGAYGFNPEDTWDSVPINTGVFNCTKNVTKIRDLIDGFVDSDLSDNKIYNVLVYFSCSGTSLSTARAKVFGSLTAPVVYPGAAGTISGAYDFYHEGGDPGQGEYTFLAEDLRVSQMLGDSNLVFSQQVDNRYLAAGPTQTDIPISNGDAINFGVEIFERKLTTDFEEAIELFNISGIR